ncbi:hypothetical protein [Roseateles sp.]|uniref:hypothetical protein n=1 Tax=Roseateles sp. TaxID=1971397 RepID=UPI0025CD34CA|nr:hypothetical protein [Roseateles sp.]
MSLGDALGLQPKATPPASSASAPTATATTAGPPAASALRPETPPSIRTTALAGVFAKTPFDGTAKTHFPRVAVTVTDWSRQDCWQAVATLWRSATQSEAVPTFSVCWGKSVGFAVNNAVSMRAFMLQSAVQHTGNVRTTGPKPPMISIPDRQPFGDRMQLAFQSFIEQLTLDTGWQIGPSMNLWIVGYDASAANAAPAVSASAPASPGADARGRAQLESALSCKPFGKFDAAGAWLASSGWRSGQGAVPVQLGTAVKVFGFSVSKVAVSRDGGEQVYRSFFKGVTSAQLVKAASLKLGKDGRAWGRVTPLGVLATGVEDGETALTCTVETEGQEG